MAWHLLGLLLVSLGLTQGAQEPAPALELDPVFASHMVLPRDVPLPVTGTAPAGATVSVGFGAQALSVVASADGRFRALLEPEPAAWEPRSLTVTSGERTLRLEDVLVGDLWLCAGQSNMAWPLRRATTGEAALARAELPGLRLWTRASRFYPGPGPFPLERLRAEGHLPVYAASSWARSDAASAAEASAVAWFFAEALLAERHVPLGLIGVAVGGSPVEAWLPRDGLDAYPDLAELLGRGLEHPAYPAWCAGRARDNLSAGRAAGIPGLRHPFEPGVLYDSALRPLSQLPLAGVLWYQGESNATLDGGTGAPVPMEQGRRKLEALVRTWRAGLGQPELPFLVVQLPGLNRPWAPYREAQARLAAGEPGVHLAVTLDLGHPTDVHPRRKQPVGQRLALLARRLVYGEAQLVAQGPRLLRAERGEQPGQVRLRLEGAAGLTTSDGQPPRAFVLVGADGWAAPARARIEGESVLLWSDAVPVPRAVAYAQAADPPVNLVGGTGLPVAPFWVEL